MFLPVMARPPGILDRFYQPESPLDVVRAVQALATESFGQIENPGTSHGRLLRPERGGLLCERIFGPLTSGCCACGQLGGPRGRPPIAPGERCNKCGVEAASSSERDRRWGHIVAARPLLHPAVASRVAELLDMAEDTVWAVARCQLWLDAQGRQVTSAEPGAATGAAALQVRLAALPQTDGMAPAALVIDRVPIPPPGDRPLIVMPGGHAMPGADTMRYAAFLSRSVRLARLTELAAPEIILLHEYRSLQQSFERLLRGPRTALDLWEPIGADGEDEDEVGADTTAAAPDGGPLLDATFGEPLDPCLPLAAALLTDGSLIIQFPYAALHAERGGRIREVFATGTARLKCTSPDGNFALFHGQDGHVRDLVARKWTRQRPEGLPCVVMEEIQESAILVDMKRGRSRRLTELGDYPTTNVMSPDGRHLWVGDKEESGGIFSAETSLLELSVAALGLADRRVPMLYADSRFIDETEGGHDEDPATRYIPRATQALVLLADNRFRLVWGSLVADDGQVILNLEGPEPVVAFHHNGEELLVVRRNIAVLVDLSIRPYVVQRFDLTSIHAALQLSGLVRRRAQGLDPLLVHYGGAWALAKTTLPQLRKVPGLPAARIGRVHRALKELRPPRRLRVIR